MISHIHNKNLYGSSRFSTRCMPRQRAESLRNELQLRNGLKHAVSEDRYSLSANINGIRYTIARTMHERVQAYRLVYRAYIEARLMEQNPFRMRVTPHHLLPGTDVLIATHGDQVICTLSLVRDGDSGLPMDVIYQNDVDFLRRGKSNLAEITCLASATGYFDRTHMYNIFIRMLSFLGQSARYRRIDKMLLAVHPRHFRFYHRFFGCQQIGSQRFYSAVRNNPAVACVHDFARLDVEKYCYYDRIYDYPFQPWHMESHPMSADDVRLFGPVSRHCTAYAPMAA